MNLCPLAVKAGREQPGLHLSSRAVAVPASEDEPDRRLFGKNNADCLHQFADALALDKASGKQHRHALPARRHSAALMRGLRDPVADNSHATADAGTILIEKLAFA